jgi:hypothetical protein
MLAVGVDRTGDAALLWAAGADLVVTTLNDVAVDQLVWQADPRRHQSQEDPER